MNKTLFILLLFTFNINIAQNLVPNPSFEQMNNCPTIFGDFSVANWNLPTQGSPDYFNSCNSGNASVPSNILGNQQAISGNAYVGFGVYDTQNVFSYREYIQVQLQQTLTIGQKYWASFYVSLADSSIYAIQELGAYFSPTQINDNTMDSTLMFSPQIEFSDSVITSKSDWTKISGSFTAIGNENYVIIGNFNRKQTTTATQVSTGNQNTSYYYVDYVCVANDSLTCNQAVSVNENILTQASFNIYPNPATDHFIINSNLINESYEVTIYNTLGQTLFSERGITMLNKKINITNFNSNLLFIKIKSNNQTFNYKLLNP